MFCYDITWCGNECDNMDCERNLKNKPSEITIYSMAYLKDTIYCQLSNEDRDKGDSE